jgi:hypothetical protein
VAAEALAQLKHADTDRFRARERPRGIGPCSEPSGNPEAVIETSMNFPFQYRPGLGAGGHTELARGVRAVQ